jgi:hypothetical protein
MIEFLSQNGSGLPKGELDKNWVLDSVTGVPPVNTLISGIPTVISQITYDNLFQPAQQYFSLLSLGVSANAPAPSGAPIKDRGILFLFF